MAVDARICAVVLNYRNAGLTLTCLRSLRGQGVGRAIVLDNSGDAYAAGELHGALQALRDERCDFDLLTITPSENLGFARGVNAALKAALQENCDRFLLLNNDAVAAPGMVMRLAAALDGGCRIAIPTVVADSGVAVPALWYQRYFGCMTSMPLPGSFLFPSGCCVMFDRSLLHAGALFDEAFFMYGEDVLLGWQLSRAGIAVCRVDEAVVRHTGRASSTSRSLFYEYHTARAHVLLGVKTWRFPLEIPLLLIAKCAGLALRAAARSVRGGGLIPLRAFVLAWRKLDMRLP